MDCENNYNNYDDDVEVLFSVGRRFLTGNGVEKDVVKGKEMLTQAAMMGHSLAQQLLDHYKEQEQSAEVETEDEPQSEIDKMLAYNKKFVESKAYEEYKTSKFPDKKIAIVTCMDTLQNSV